MNINLPKFDIDLRREGDGPVQVYDRLRAKYVALTPEEWVRQHFVNYLIEHIGYPAHLMANEVGIRHNGVMRRCDTVVYGRDARPAAIVEYKASTVAITERVFDQIVRYNMVLGVDWLMVSNGMCHFCCQVDHESQAYRFVKQIPPYSVLVDKKKEDGD